MWIWFNWNRSIDTKYIGVGVGVSVDADDSIELNFNWISN